MVARVRLPILAIAGVDDIALGLPVAGCSLRRSVADAPARAAADGLVDAPHERPVRVHDEDELGDERRIPAPEDRKSVGEGKSVSVRFELGGRRVIKKKKTENRCYR